MKSKTSVLIKPYRNRSQRSLGDIGDTSDLLYNKISMSQKVIKPKIHHTELKEDSGYLLLKKRQEKLGWCVRTDQRFRWQIRPYLSKAFDPFSVNLKYKKFKIKNEFDGGFQRFFNKNQVYKPGKKIQNLSTFENTKRVIIPEKNV